MLISGLKLSCQLGHRSSPCGVLGTFSRLMLDARVSCTMCLWLARPVLLRVGCTCACATGTGLKRSAWRTASLCPGPQAPLGLQHGFRSRPWNSRPQAPRAKFWSRDRLPYDEDPHDPWGNDSDVEDDYRSAATRSTLLSRGLRASVC